MKKEEISIQLYTIRSLTADDFEGALKQVADAGYEAVEFAGYQGKTPRELKDLLDRYGLRTSSAHVPLSDFQTRLDGVVEDLTTLGAEWAIVPWIAPEDRSAASLEAIASQFDGFANRLAEANIKFGYHNHDFEFNTLTEDGSTVFDKMVSVTTPGLVSFELDAFWAAVGGYDPAAVIRANADRIKLVHLKDGVRSDLRPGADVPFGQGDLDWDDILDAARAAGVEWYVTEQDTPNPDDILGDITIAYQNAVKVALVG